MQCLKRLETCFCSSVQTFYKQPAITPKRLNVSRSCFARNPHIFVDNLLICRPAVGLEGSHSFLNQHVVQWFKCFGTSGSDDPTNNFSCQFVKSGPNPNPLCGWIFATHFTFFLQKCTVHPLQLFHSCPQGQLLVMFQHDLSTIL